MATFDERARDWDTPERIARAAEVAPAIRGALDLTGAERTIDVGAGTGLLGLALVDDVGQRHAGRSVRRDDRGRQREARRRRLPDGSRVHHDLIADPPPAEPFDLAVSMLVLHHIEDTAAALAGVHALLGPGRPDRPRRPRHRGRDVPFARGGGNPSPRVRSGASSSGSPERPASSTSRPGRRCTSRTTTAAGRATRSSCSPGGARRRRRAPERQNPRRRPGRAAGRLDELDEHAVARPRVDERDRSLGAAARRAVDQLEAVDLEPEQRLGEVRDLEADVVEALALASRGSGRRRSCRRSARRARPSTRRRRGTRSGRGRAAMSMIVSSSSPRRSRQSAERILDRARRSARRDGSCRGRGWRAGTRSAVRASRHPRPARSSDRDQLAVDAERGPQPVADLADRRVGLDRLDDRRQQVVRAARGVLEPGERGRPGGRVALGADPPDALDLAPLALGIDPLERRPDLPRPVVAEAC